MPRSVSLAPALAATIQRLRHQQGFSQERLALDADVAAVSRLERTVTNPSWSTIRTTTTLGIKLHQLANAIETKTPAPVDSSTFAPCRLPPVAQGLLMSSSNPTHLSPVLCPFTKGLLE